MTKKEIGNRSQPVQYNKCIPQWEWKMRWKRIKRIPIEFGDAYLQAVTLNTTDGAGQKPSIPFQMDTVGKKPTHENTVTV